MRIYISADIEGIVGVTSWDQTEQHAFEYDKGRQWMTRSVVAAVEGAQAAGATEIVVSDSHGNGQNLLLDELPDCVRLVRSWPRPLSMMQGIDDGRFDAALLVGFHAGAGSVGGILAHTLTGSIRELRVNGEPMNEAMLAAAVASEHHVPVVMASGDDACIQAIEAQIPGVESACVKVALGQQASTTVTPTVACALIRSAALRGIQRRREIAPFRLRAPLAVEVAFRSRLQAEILCFLPCFERYGSHSVRFTCSSAVELLRIFSFVDDYRSHGEKF